MKARIRSGLSYLPVLAGLILAGVGAHSSEAQSVAGIPVHRRNTARAVGDRTTAIAAAPTDGNAAYHYGATLLCSDCHSAHFSQSHGFAGGTVSQAGTPGGDWLTASGPNSYLLKSPSPTELCLSCHDGQTFAPDVVDVDTYGVGERSAGHFAAIEMPNYRGHKISRAPGGKAGSSELCNRCHFGGTFGDASVQCTDCHNPHGNGYYRNLWWASDPGNEPPILASIRGGATGKARYEATNVGYPAPAGGEWAEVTNICIDCHHTFFAPYYTDEGEWPGGFSPYHRHPGANTEWGGSYPINRSGAHTDPVNWVDGAAGFTVRRLPFAVIGASDFNSATSVAANNQVFCLSCHKAHGSENPFSLRWDYGAASATSSAGCRQCHNNVFGE